MLTTLNLELSRKIFELVGEYPTKNHYDHEDKICDCGLKNEGIPAPNFAEVIREVLPRIGEKKAWRNWSGPKHTNIVDHHGFWLMKAYKDAPTEKEGMEQVEKYLEGLL